MNEKVKFYLKCFLVVLFTLLIGYGFLTGKITLETIIDLFRAFADVAG